MQDNRISLDGAWEFLHVADDRLSGPAEVRQIVVPSPWQAQFSDLRMRAGIGIYRKTIHIDESWLHDSIWLRFGAVFHNSKVFINDEAVGSNEGGFLPFSFDVTSYLGPGANEIKVRVDSPTDNPAEFPDSPFAEIPFGKQSWYGPLSGIWQPVHLERRISDHMNRVRLVPSLATGRVYHLENNPPPDANEGLDPGPFVQRDDDTEEALRRQLESWREEAEEIKKHYDEQGILAVIDAGQEVSKITEDIIEALGHPPKR